MRNIKLFKKISLALILALLFMLQAGCGQSGYVDSADAGAMKLEAFEGMIQVRDESGADTGLREHMNLYSGYDIDTMPASFAWIDLDADKMLKLDEVSRAGLSQEDRHLRITLEQGAMFFCVQKLGDDESMDIDVGGEDDLTMAIRGTTGFVQIGTEDEYTIALYEGKIEATCGDENFTITNGEKAKITVGEDGSTEISVTELDIARDTPAFVLDELLKDTVRTKLEEAGVDVTPIEGIEGYSEDSRTRELIDRISERWPWETASGDLTLGIDIDRWSYTVKGGVLQPNATYLEYGLRAQRHNVTAIGENSLRFYGEPIGDEKVMDTTCILTISDDNNTLTMETGGETYVFTSY